ncbi:uncharacterized protein AKAW2_51995S [Aspergillus luchuensis]|uniref:Similar to An06g00500 n=1 Tax=Aspergillus kawachii TaxID=1069201 RepID=A0A146FB20_ASPKA|nr:uncharacterized protein AKAW2_51995S [Aspergillus luchuensis]BCS01654.1 hypothetical protein AKAW2_51995S [Aspergillus luchuensis]BCS13365.1 hypothetical protein ALUC_51411S [Aspergillus luchuensis]GAT22671.1 similar to An06g00500 [Aspergillus luchuensis]
MTTTSQNPTGVLKKAVLVHAPDLDVSCRARLRIIHDQAADQGCIFLSITADLANLSGKSQVLTLNIPPESVEQCALARQSNSELCPSHFVSMLPAPVTNVSAVSTLSLSLCATGIVLCPSKLDYISPARPGDLDIHSFAKICQSQFLYLHFSRRQFVNKELDKLEIFFRALRTKSLKRVSFDHSRHGMVQKDWRVFNLSPNPPPYRQELLSEQLEQVDPPLYCEESVSEQVVRKRQREPWSVSSHDESRKRVLLQAPPPLGSPTEVNTPSTRSPSPSSIRPTIFQRASSPGDPVCKKLARLEHELRGVSDDLICELLIRSGRGHLLAIPKNVDRALPCEAQKAVPTEIEMVEQRLKRYVDEMIERRLKSGILDEVIDSAASECRDQIYDECKTNQAEFREQVDDGNSEVRNTTMECLKEINEQAQRHMHEIEEQAQQCMKDIEDQGIEVEMSAKRSMAELKRWFSTPAQSLPEIKSNPSREIDTAARRSSI